MNNDLLTGWHLTPLGELTENLDFMRVPIREADRQRGAFPYYGASGIVDYVHDYIFDGEYLLVAEDGENLRTRNTPVAFLARGKFWVNNHAHIMRGKNGVDTRFLMYALSNADIGGYLSGSTMPKLTQGNLNRIPILAPSPHEQKTIAHILGALDDKIELNRRMNGTLEQIARAIFKSWFVEFDPVRAKSEGRQPHGLDAETAALFPDSFERFSNDLIPTEWEVWRVGDIGNIVCGKTPPTQTLEYYGHDVPFITIPDMHGRVFVPRTQKSLSHAGAAFQQNKLLPTGAICVSCIATPGLVVITSEPSQTNQQINTVIPRSAGETYFWYWSLRNLGDEIRAGGSGGSVLSNLSTGRFSELRVLAPPTTLRSSYHSLIAPLFCQILANETESLTLAAIRDALLPKLLSGDIRICDGEAVMETLA